MQPQTNHYDIVIIGGGFAGLITALALAPLNLSLLVVDQHPPIRKHDDNRAIALNYGSQQFLNQLAVWPQLENAATAIYQVHVSEKGRFHKVRFSALEQQLPALGYTISGQHLLNALQSLVTHHPSITYYPATTLHTLHHDQRQATLQHATHRTLCQYRLLIAADGTHSTTRQRLGITCHQKETTSAAFVSCIEHQQPHQNIAYQRFTEQGTLAMLPLQLSHQSKLVITGQTDQLAVWLTYDQPTRLNQLEKMFGYFLGSLIQMTPPVQYPLLTLTTTQQVIDGAVILGNAAHTFSPIAAQGLNLTIADIRSLATILQDAITHHEAYDTLQVLARYTQARSTNQRTLQHSIERLTRLFAAHSLWLRCGRQCLFAACQHLPLLHNALANQFTGKGLCIHKLGIYSGCRDGD